MQAKLRDGLRQSASETGCLRHGGEIGKGVRGCGGMDDASGKRFDAEPGDGRKREASHGLSGEVRGKLCERQRVNALAAVRESSDGELVGGGSRWSDDQDFAVSFFRSEERSGAIEQRGVGAGVNQRARDQRQLYVAHHLLTCAVQSVRSAVMGSVRAAEREGARAATTAQIMRSAATIAMVSGSRALV